MVSFLARADGRASEGRCAEPLGRNAELPSGSSSNAWVSRPHRSPLPPGSKPDATIPFALFDRGCRRNFLARANHLAFAYNPFFHIRGTGRGLPRVRLRSIRSRRAPGHFAPRSGSLARRHLAFARFWLRWQVMCLRVSIRWRCPDRRLPHVCDRGRGRSASSRAALDLLPLAARARRARRTAAWRRCALGFPEVPRGGVGGGGGGTSQEHRGKISSPPFLEPSRKAQRNPNAATLEPGGAMIMHPVVASVLPRHGSRSRLPPRWLGGHASRRAIASISSSIHSLWGAASPDTRHGRARAAACPS